MAIQLDGKQNEVLALPPMGHIVILGTAGSGKTTMALYRAIFLANLPDNPGVLLATYNNALIDYMSKIISTNKPNLIIENYHKFARGYLNYRGKMPSHNGICEPEPKKTYIEVALKEEQKESPSESTYKRVLSFFLDEIMFIERFGIKTLDEYESAERIGRASVNLKRENRKWVWKIYERYLALRKADGYRYDWDDLAFYVYKELQVDKNERRYKHIIVDEGQDFSPMMLKSLVSAVKHGGSFTFFGDVAQQIYGSRLTWRDSGIKIEGKIWKFTNNYRNPTSILDFAADLIKSIYWKSDGDMVLPAPKAAAGPKPVLIQFKSQDNEYSWLIRMASNASKIGSVVIICRNRAIIDEIKAKFREKGVNTTTIDKDKAGFAHLKNIYLSTFHSAKGLEFDNVFMPLLNDNIIPDNETLNSAEAKEEVLADELKLLYVAVTRSKYALFISYNNILSRLFPVSSGNYEKKNEADL